MLGAVSADIFPPQAGGYMGDHIVITSPGKYNLERDVNHSYPVGIVILSSSVVINGNDNTISPSAAGKETVGIWIAAYDQQGMPITGITLRDIHIQDETYGIFIEGDTPAPFSWAADSKAQAGSTRQSLRTQMIDIISVTISACTTGIGVSDGIGVRITDAEISDNEYGIIASGRDLTVNDSIITKNAKIGLLLDDVTQTSLSQNTITANTIDVEARNNSIDTLREIDNTYNNQQNIVAARTDMAPITDISFAFPVSGISLPISPDERTDYPIEPETSEQAEVHTPSMIQDAEPTPLIMETQFPASVPSPSIVPSPTPEILPVISMPMPTPTQAPLMNQATETTPLIMDIQLPASVPSPSAVPSPTPETLPAISMPTPTQAPLMNQATEPTSLIMDIQLPASVPSPSAVPSPTPEALAAISMPMPTPTQAPKQTVSETPKSFITGIHATIIDDTIPDILASGSRTSVRLVIANTGSVAWREDDGIGISAIGDTAQYAPAWQNVPVKRNEKKDEYNLEFSLTAPTAPGEYTFSFQAGKKRLELTSTFGRPYTKTVLIT